MKNNSTKQTSAKQFLQVFKFAALFLVAIILNGCKDEHSPDEIEKLLSEMVASESGGKLAVVKFEKTNGMETMEPFQTTKLYQTEANVTLEFKEDCMFTGMPYDRTKDVFKTKPYSESEYGELFSGFFYVKGKKDDKKTYPFIIKTETTEQGDRIQSVLTNFTKNDLK